MLTTKIESIKALIPCVNTGKNLKPIQALGWDRKCMEISPARMCHTTWKHTLHLDWFGIPSVLFLFLPTEEFFFQPSRQEKF